MKDFLCRSVVLWWVSVVIWCGGCGKDCGWSVARVVVALVWRLVFVTIFCDWVGAWGLWSGERFGVVPFLVAVGICVLSGASESWLGLLLVSCWGGFLFRGSWVFSFVLATSSIFFLSFADLFGLSVVAFPSFFFFVLLGVLAFFLWLRFFGCFLLSRGC